MDKSTEMFAQADEIQKRADEIKRQASAERQRELTAKPIADRIVYAAYSRCPCGAGLAYDPCHEDESSPFKGSLSGYWDCSAILLGEQDRSVTHTAKLPFSFYEVKSEEQPSVHGATTRPSKREA